MVRTRLHVHGGPGGSPHACGDGPLSSLSRDSCTSFSPRVWGWSVRIREAGRGHAVLPTRVGMVRVGMASMSSRWSSPHACGDGPCGGSIGRRSRWFSPRVWGWSVAGACSPRVASVLPTRVGMVRKRVACSLAERRFSPRVWGWSVDVVDQDAQVDVLPTRVGMVRSVCERRPAWSGSPHACGDGPR